MSRDADNEQTRQGNSGPGGPLAGERLAAARREKQITIPEVAKELHLDDHKVQALEQNQFDVLGAPVFAKGHLRKYAQLVGVSVEQVLGDYYELNRATGMPPVVGKVRKPEREFSPGPVLATVIVLLLVAIAYWFFVVRDPSPAATDVPEQAPVTETEEAGDIQLDTGPTETAVEIPPAVVEAVQAEREAPVEEVVRQPPAATPQLPDGEVQLALTFSGDCWTEITDAGGRRLFFDLGRNGRTVSVSGRAPLSVLFGNAENVSVQVNGEAYSIRAADRRGQTARLTIDGP